MSHQVTVRELRDYQKKQSIVLASETNKKKLYWTPFWHHYMEEYRIYEYKNGTWVCSFRKNLEAAVEKYNSIF